MSNLRKESQREVSVKSFGDVLSYGFPQTEVIDKSNFPNDFKVSLRVTAMPTGQLFFNS